MSHPSSAQGAPNKTLAAILFGVMGLGLLVVGVLIYVLFIAGGHDTSHDSQGLSHDAQTTTITSTVWPSNPVPASAAATAGK